MDLLYKILLEINVPQIGHSYDANYLGQFLPQLIPLFGLVPFKKVNLIFPDQDEILQLKSQLTTLEKSYSSGDYIAKEKKNIEQTIKNLREKLNELNEIIKVKEQIENNFNILRMDLYLIDAYNNLRKKLGLEELTHLEFYIACNRKNIIRPIYEYEKKKLLDFTSIKRILENVNDHFLTSI